MENKSFDQLYRMLKLINHKQVNKVNIKEAIHKADRSGILLNEEDEVDTATKDDGGFDLDFLVNDETINKDAQKIISRPIC